MRHVISVNQRRVEQARILRLHAHREKRHESFAELHGEESRGSDDVVNVIFADVHDVLALVDAVLHALHELLHRLLLLREALSALSSRTIETKREVDAVGEKELHVVQRKRFDVFQHVGHIGFVVRAHLVLQVSTVAIEISDVERCEELRG